MPATAIREATVSLFDVFQNTLQFTPGLNIICGENGTCKTQVLMSMRNNNNYRTDTGQNGGLRISAISPRRNAERRTIETSLQNLRQSDTRIEPFLAQYSNRGLQDNSFETYPSIGDLFLVQFQERCRQGGDPIRWMEETLVDFNGVIRRIFENYELVATWNPSLGNQGAPQVNLRKFGRTMALDRLSLGEQQILSLTLYLYVSQANFDVAFIDEPEIHLNWHLEDRLFRFFDYMAQQHSKQLIVVTHSRAVFQRDFLPKCQFFHWQEGAIRVSRALNPTQRSRIAGEAIEVLRLGEFPKPTIFVEDSMHKRAVEALATSLGGDVEVVPCGTKSNVRSLHQAFKQTGSTNRVLFVEDGDNEGNPHPNDPSFVHLDVYCIENCLLQLEPTAHALSKTVAEIQELISHAIKARSNAILGAGKGMAFLLDALQPTQITKERLARLDCSSILQHVLDACGKSIATYLPAYIAACQALGVLDRAFPSQLLLAVTAPTVEQQPIPA